MPLLMVDLDNTLIDRAAAYRRWAEAFVAERCLPAVEVDWLVEADGDGFVSREQVAAQIVERFGLGGAGASWVVEELRRGMVDHLELAPEVPVALVTARSAGWRIVCVTNGTAEQQRRKIEATGLADHLDAVVISGAVGVRKPDPLIFQLAAEIVRLPLGDSWMIGDSADADIVGGASVGARTAWLRRGRAWSRDGLTPTVMVDDFLRRSTTSSAPPEPCTPSDGGPAHLTCGNVADRGKRSILSGKALRGARVRAGQGFVSGPRHVMSQDIRNARTYGCGFGRWYFPAGEQTER